MRVPLATAGLRKQDVEIAIEVLKTGQLTMGFQVDSFEKEMAEYLGVSYFTMVNSGSSANLAIIEALLRPTTRNSYVKQGDSFLVPSIAWPTTIWPLVQLGLKPVFVDVERDTLAIDLLKCRELIKKRSTGEIKGIFPIHPLGLGIPSENLLAFAKEYDLILINDVCESLGSWENVSHSGTAGLMASFSFYFSHHITSMEGGGIATNSREVWNDLRSIRSHGWSRDRSDVADWSMEVHPSLKKFNFISTGYNIRPMEIQAAIGRSQLRDIDKFIQTRRDNVSRVAATIKETKLQVVGVSDYTKISETKSHSWMHIPIRINSKNAKRDRLRVVRFLEDCGIETRPPLTGNFLRQPAMKQFLQESNSYEGFPVADEVSESVFLVGCHHDLTSEQISYLCNCLMESSRLI